MPPMPPMPQQSPTVLARKIAIMSRAEPGAERKRTRLNAPATATPAPRLPLTSRMTICTIQEDDLPHVFDRFYRSDKSLRSESGSFGLGLAITKEMAEKLGGEISVSSSAEDGTVFQVTLWR